MNPLRHPTLCPLALAACVALAACSRAAPQTPPPAPVADRESVQFPAGSPQLGQIVSAPAEVRKETILRFNGRLTWDEDRTARVFTPFAGRVQSMVARAGDEVRANQPLAWVASPELGQAQSDARKSEQDYALAAKSLARVDELHTAGVAPLKDLQAAQADLARTAAERTRTVQRLKLYGATDGVDQRLALRSPVSGVVVERNLNPGQELRTDQGDKALFVVSDPTRLWFTLDVPEIDVRAVHPGDSVQIGCAALGEEKVAGKIVHVADGLDPQSRTIKVRGAINNAERKLKAEMFITAELALPSGGGLVVPTKAVYLRGDQHFVFIDAGGGKFVRRAVRLGPASQSQQVILEGVAGTDKVVTDGSLLLQQMLAARE